MKFSHVQVICNETCSIESADLRHVNRRQKVSSSELYLRKSPAIDYLQSQQLEEVVQVRSQTATTTDNSVLDSHGLPDLLINQNLTKPTSPDSQKRHVTEALRIIKY